MKRILAFLLAPTLALAAPAVAEYGDGITQKFNPSNVRAGFNFGTNATDPSSLFNGDAWVNSTNWNAYLRLNGVSQPFVFGLKSVGGNGAADAGKVAIYGLDGQLSGGAGNGNTAVSGFGTQYGGYFTGDIRGLIGDSGAGTGLTAQSSSGTYIAVFRDEGGEIDRLLIRRTDGAIVYNGGVAVTPAAVSGAMLTSGSSLLAANLTGTVAAGRMPALTGPVSTTVGNVATSLKFLDELQLVAPHQVDGTGAIIDTLTTSPTSGHAIFSGTAAATGNYALYRLKVPADLDTSVDLQVSFTYRLGAADTGAHSYVISMSDTATSASADNPTFSNAVTITGSADAAGASGDNEITSYQTLTGWRTSLTAGRILVVKLARNGNTDASTVSSSDVNLSIKYGRTQ